MRTFFAKIRSNQRPRLHCPRPLAAGTLRAADFLRDRRSSMHLKPGGQDGFLLVEVIVSALLVALIVVATFNGFDVVNRAQADNRAHDQAVILAAQSQEQLRTDPVTTLNALYNNPHKYSQTINGTEYKITQEAAPSNGSANTTGCSAIETTKQSGANVLITSAVTWSRLSLAKRPEVKLSSIITPPTGSGLEVDVGNAPAPTEGVSGVGVTVTYTPTGSATPATLEGTTNSAGCVVFGDIESTAATVAIAEKSGFVTTSGALKYPTKEVKLAPNITVHDAVVYTQGAAIKANFTWEGAAVTGDTFVAYDTMMLVAPTFQVGSTLFSYEGSGEEHYQAETGKFASSATTAKGTRYSTGDLFPFLKPNEWVVYAGDCVANNAHTIDAVIENGHATANSGGTVEVNVPMTKTNLVVREGTQKSPGSTASLPVKITNTACNGSPTPNNASKLNLEHKQNTTSAGLLEFPYQPFGAYELCVASKAAKKRFKFSSTNTTPAGSSPAIFLGAKSASEKATVKTTKEGEEKATETARKTAEKAAEEKRKKEEKEAKEKRETEEKPAKEKWENEEKTNKTTKETQEATKATRLAKEKTEVEQWKKEEECQISKNKNSAACIASGKKEITKKQKEEKEAAQKVTRTAAEKTEKEAKEKLEKEEKTTKEAREKQENTQKGKEKEEEEAKTKKVKEEEELKTKKLKEEKETKEKREKEEKEETEEATATKVTVESGFETC